MTRRPGMPALIVRHGWLCLTIWFLAAEAQAQGYVRRDPLITPEAALEMMRGGHPRAEQVIILAFTEWDPLGGASASGNLDRYTSAERRELLDGLEEIAIRTDPAAEHGNPGSSAMVLLSGLHLDPNLIAPELFTKERMLRIHRNSSNRGIKCLALWLLAQYAAESDDQESEIIDLLASIAAEPQRVDEVNPSMALALLFDTCEKGTDAVRRLYEEGRAGNSDVRMGLVGKSMTEFAPRRGTSSIPCGVSWAEAAMSSGAP